MENKIGTNNDSPGTVGIVDVGGGNRDAFGCGVFDYLMDHNIILDCCIGVSAGSANCVSYISKQRGRNYRFYTGYNLSNKAISLGNYIFKGSFIDLDYIYCKVSNEDGKDPFDYDGFCSSDQKLFIVATDAQSGDPVYFQNDSLKRNDYRVLSASSNLAGINKAYGYNGRDYFDGGYSDPIPFRKAFQEGCEKVIIILTLPKDYRRENKNDLKLAKKMKEYPGMKNRINEKSVLYNEQLEEAIRLESEGKILILAPDEKADLGSLGKNKEEIIRLYEEGYAKAEQIRDLI